MKRPRIPSLQPRIATLKTPARISTPSTDSRAVYSSRKWRERVRPAKLRRDPLCQRCKVLDRVTQAHHVDHWIRISEGGDAWADGNLVSLCTDHHTEKTTAERAGAPLFEIAPSAARVIGWLE